MLLTLWHWNQQSGNIGIFKHLGTHSKIFDRSLKGNYMSLHNLEKDR